MSRLIDADSLMERKQEEHGYYDITDSEFEELVKTQPTAYDVEKVEAELEKQRKEADYWSNDANDYFSGKEFAYCDAITKVRRGGVE